ncbi:MAG: PilZ domain-containing protein [Hyphomicrobiaceae bacterium]|jgi:hypothetical protein
MNFVFVEKEPAHRAKTAGEDKAIKEQLPIVVGQAPQPRRVHAPTPAKPADKRRARRKSVNLAGEVSDGSQQSFSCIVQDMSAMGAMLELHAQSGRRTGTEIQLPERFFLVIENLLERSVVECYVMWQRGHRAGVQFIGPIDTTAKKLPARRPSNKSKGAASLRR